MTDLTPEQRARRLYAIVVWNSAEHPLNPDEECKYPEHRQMTLNKLETEIRAVEQAAREKALRDAVNAICPLHHTGMPFDEVEQIHIGQAGSYACSAINILRLLEEKND